MDFKFTWRMRSPDDQIAKLYPNPESDSHILTLYWGSKWGYGDGFTFSGGIGGTYYDHNPIEADSIPEAMEKTIIWLSEKIENCRENCLRSAAYYADFLAALQCDPPREIIYKRS